MIYWPFLPALVLREKSTSKACVWRWNNIIGGRCLGVCSGCGGLSREVEGGGSYGKKVSFITHFWKENVREIAQLHRIGRPARSDYSYKK